MTGFGPAFDPQVGCITCGATATAMRVLEVDADRGLALCVDGEGARESVEIALIGAVQTGDSLLVHAGTALQRLDG